MKILVIGYMHSKHDKRVFRTVQAFSKCHDVLYQYLANEKEDNYKDGNISYIPVQYGKISEKKSMWEYLKEALRRVNFDRKILHLIESVDCDVVYFHHFLPTMPVKAFRLAKKLQRTVIYDVHEYHPQNFLSFLPGTLKKLKEYAA